jgi:hypothetical protein
MIIITIFPPLYATGIVTGRKKHNGDGSASCKSGVCTKLTALTPDFNAASRYLLGFSFLPYIFSCFRINGYS